jgi:hypothetical protein
LFASSPSRTPRPTSKSHLARARGRCPAESEWRATRETARLRGLTSWKKLQPHFRLYCHYYRRISSALRHASTCVLPRNATQHLKWAWLVPTIPLPPDDRLIDNSILPSIRRFFFFVDRRPALLAFFFPVPGTRPSPHGTLYSLAACRLPLSLECCLLQPFRLLQNSTSDFSRSTS